MKFVTTGKILSATPFYCSVTLPANTVDRIIWLFPLEPNRLRLDVGLASGYQVDLEPEGNV
jgi:hypothetical protein